MESAHPSSTPSANGRHCSIFDSSRAGDEDAVRAEANDMIQVICTADIDGGVKETGELTRGPEFDGLHM